MRCGCTVSKVQAVVKMLVMQSVPGKEAGSGFWRRPMLKGCSWFVASAQTPSMQREGVLGSDPSWMRSCA